MIIVSDTATFAAPVTVFIPGEDGQLADQTATFTFKYYTREEFVELNAKLQSGELKDDAFLRQITTGWGADIVDKKQKSIPFNDANFAKVLSVHGLSKAMIESYFKHVNAASAKNLKALLSPAPAAE
jgi:hypothetical protein